MATPARNTLFYGDNLTILREHIADGSVDLIDLDPPFNSNARRRRATRASARAISISDPRQGALAA
jgi:16S rRNA G966 N2-methylase RsmD